MELLYEMIFIFQSGPQIENSKTLSKFLMQNSKKNNLKRKKRKHVYRRKSDAFYISLSRNYQFVKSTERERERERERLTATFSQSELFLPGL